MTARALRRPTAALLPTVMMILAVVVLAWPVRGTRLSSVDAQQHVAAAANMLESGVFSTYFDYRGPGEPVGVTPRLEPDHRREPLTAFLLLPFLATATGWDRDCLVEADREPRCGPALRRAKLANVVLLAALALASWGLARSAGVRPGGAALFGLVVALSPTMLSQVDDVMNTLPTAVLLTAAAALGPAALSPGSRPAVAAALGVLAGASVLTRFANLLILALAAAVVLVASEPQRRAAVARRVGVTAVVAALVVTPWVVRNLRAVGSPTVAAGADLVLAVRAEATGFTWTEYALAVPAYTPQIGRPLLRALAPEDDWERWHRDEGDRSFLALAVGSEPGGEVQRRAGRDGDVRAAAIGLILDRPVRSALLTVPYTYRGLWVRPRDAALRAHESALVRGYGWLSGPVANVVHVAAVPLAAVALWRARRARDRRLLGLSLLALCTIAVYGALTHFIPRYSEPLVPLLYLLALVAVRPRLRCAPRP